MPRFTIQDEGTAARFLARNMQSFAKGREGKMNSNDLHALHAAMTTYAELLEKDRVQQALKRTREAVGFDKLDVDIALHRTIQEMKQRDMKRTLALPTPATGRLRLNHIPHKTEKQGKTPPILVCRVKPKAI